MSTKECTICKQQKPATPENWKGDKRKPDGFMRECRACVNARILKRKREERAASKLRTLLVLSDVHVPENDKRVWSTTLELLKDVKPSEVILLGDFLELASVSLHGGAELEKLTDDFMAGKQALQQLREAAGDACLITYLEGNHESRLSRYLAAKAPSLIESLSCEVGLGLKERNIEWVPEGKQPVSRGELDLTHGHQDLRERPSKYHANKMAEVYGRPGRTVLYGHTHKPQVFTRPAVGGYATAVGMGCARTLTPGWLHGANAGWVHQVAVVYITEAGRVTIYPITFQHGQAVWNGKLYGAVEKEPEAASGSDGK